MKIFETSIFRGPNVYAKFPVIRHVVDIGILEDWPPRVGSVGSISPISALRAAC